MYVVSNKRARPRGLRNGALPPRNGYETLRHGALGSEDTFFTADDGGMLTPHRSPPHPHETLTDHI